MAHVLPFKEDFPGFLSLEILPTWARECTNGTRMYEWKEGPPGCKLAQKGLKQCYKSHDLL